MLHVTENDALTPEEQALRNQRTVKLTGKDPAAKREEVLRYFHATYDLYERLFEPLENEGLYTRADRLRHMLAFYYGHTAVFFINKLLAAKVIKDRVNRHYESLFAIGVDEMSWDDIPSDDFEWPEVSKIKAYRDEVRTIVDGAIRTAPLSLPITWESPFYAIIMGIEHEHIHLETSSVLIRQLPLKCIKSGPHPLWAACEDRARPQPADQELLQVNSEPAEVTLGVEHGKYDEYGWDNEFGTQTSTVPPFKASRYLVTNGEFLEFVRDGGYATQSLWTEEGWRFSLFREEIGRRHPPFWVPDESSPHGFRLRLMLEEVDMPLNWPVEVNQLEAKAYCNWLRARTNRPIRLPTEDEYALLRSRELPTDFPAWGDKSPANVNLEYYASSTPVDAFPATPSGFRDVVGNVWQHTETPMDAFCGFKVHPIYDDFSVPTFDLQHNMIKGGAWASMGNEAMPSARYAFRRHFYQHAGFRYVETEREVKIRSDRNERDDAVHKYCHFHYGEQYFGVENFQTRVAAIARSYFADGSGRTPGRALDIGCATGRLAFELAPTFERTLGLDFSARFIRKAIELQEDGVVKYTVVDEGELTSTHAVGLVESVGADAAAAARDRLEFFQADACNLDPRYTGYDLVTAINLIDHLQDPAVFLATVHSRVNCGGILVLGTTGAWDEAVTPRDKWIGGTHGNDGERKCTLAALEELLEGRFRRVDEPVDVPFVFRENARTFTHGVSQISVWVKVC